MGVREGEMVGEGMTEKLRRELSYGRVAGKRREGFNERELYRKVG
jgi:hypothetical protein